MKMTLGHDPRVQPRYSAPRFYPRVWHAVQLADEIFPDFWCPARTYSPPPPTRQANRELARIGLRVVGLVPLHREAMRQADWALFPQSRPKCATGLKCHRLKQYRHLSCSLLACYVGFPHRVEPALSRSIVRGFHPILAKSLDPNVPAPLATYLHTDLDRKAT